MIALHIQHLTQYWKPLGTPRLACVVGVQHVGIGVPGLRPDVLDGHVQGPDQVGARGCLVAASAGGGEGRDVTGVCEAPQDVADQLVGQRVDGGGGGGDSGSTTIVIRSSPSSLLLLPLRASLCPSVSSRCC